MIKGFDFYKNKYGLRTSSEIHLGLERIEAFLAGIGNPQQDLKAVHIAGTNGKGSTVQFLKMILSEAGYSVGTFTSPYLEDVTDQISTLAGPIGKEGMEAVLDYLLSHSSEEDIGQLTDFELLTVLAILYFARISKQDIVLFETGMGGLTDSTNVLQSIVSIITNISLEHTAFLGNSIEKIALQKAGIIKKGKPAIIGVRDKEALAAIERFAEQQQARTFILDRDFWILEEKGDKFRVESAERVYSSLSAGLKGSHQIENSALAVMAAEVLKNEYDFEIEEDQIKNGLLKARWPGRFEVLSEKPGIILDGAHNSAAVSRLVDTLRKEFPQKKVKFVFAALRDKNVDEMLAMLEPIAEEITFADFDFPRAAPAEELAAMSRLERKFIAGNLAESLPAIIDSLEEGDLLVITGSLYFIAEARLIVELKNKGD